MTQTPLTLIDVANWLPDDFFATYPEGARDKRAFFPPPGHGLCYINDSRRYMFKYSDKRYPEQYWSEIVACVIGSMMGVDVPPAYPAIDSSREKSAALIEWFYEDGQQLSVLGGRFMQMLIPGFDMRLGTQHNFKTIRLLFHAFHKKGMTQDWLIQWAKGLVFDTMIGNTDRHQNNWALLFNDTKVEMAPWFDNGTSLGYERWERHAQNWSSTRLDQYLYNGEHHLRWDKLDQNRCKFFELPALLLGLDPSLRAPMVNCVNALDLGKLSKFLDECVAINCYVPLSRWRADFMLRLIKRRQEILVEVLS